MAAVAMTTILRRSSSYISFFKWQRAESNHTHFKRLEWIVLDSDAEEFGGHKRLDPTVKFHTFPEPCCNRANHLFVYLPTRTAIVLARTA